MAGKVGLGSEQNAPQTPEALKMETSDWAGPRRGWVGVAKGGLALVEPPRHQAGRLQDILS